MGARIHQLPESVANRIAAGEVVERPVAVVKELVENALDAQARAIDIQFEKGGKALIRVIDDGHGMEREDALLALRRHATSKIRDVPDILNIRSFGFRGEALPSIASVSQFVLKTRTGAGVAGTEIRVNAGRKPEVRDCGMSPGTEVVVSNLFHGVPARRKFLKTDRTEAAHILQMCRLLAVAHPEVAFSLTEDGHEVFRSPVCPDRQQRVREVFGKRRVDDLVPVDAEHEGIRLHGLIGRPGVGRSTRSELITFVNLRPVESRLLGYALIESYHRYLPRGRYPLAFLFIEVPPGEVDVNVHPTKREVRFRNESRIRQIVMSQLVETLAAHSPRGLSRSEPVPPVSTGEQPSVPAAAHHPSPEKAPARDPRPFPELKEKPFADGSRQAPEHSSPRSASGGSRQWPFIGVLHRRTGLFESADGLVLMNPRAARERILLERISRSLAGHEIPRQTLLLPPMLELSPLNAGVLSDQLAFFEELGFEIEPFGRHLFRIRGVPVWLQQSQPEAFVEDLVNRIRERGLRPEDIDTAHLLVARIAAAGEARGFRPASEAEWQRLARDLLSCENPLLDGRGRPTFVELRHAELARRLMLESKAEASEHLEGGA